MKAITIRQPWATLIADGVKLFETRSWKTNYRGRLAIHSAKKWDRYGQQALEAFYPKLIEYRTKAMPCGYILAITTLVDVVPVEKIRYKLTPLQLHIGHYDNGWYAWKLEDVEWPTFPIPVTGKLGLWEWNR